MASSGAHIQSPVSTCSEHEKEELSALCLTCIQRICELCLKEKHLQHDWLGISRIARVVRKNAEEREKVLQEILSLLKQASSDAKNDEDIRRIDKIETSLHSMISEYATRLRTMMRKGKSGRDLSTEMAELENLITFFSHHVHEAHDNVIFEMEEVFLRTCQIYREGKKRPESSPRFIEGKVSANVMSCMFGSVVQVERDDEGDDTNARVKSSILKRSDKEVSGFTHGKESIITIAPISETHAWINEYNAKQIDCIDMNGTVTATRTMKSYSADFIILEGTEFIYTVFGDKIIRRSFPFHDIQKICSTSPLFPVGICRAHDDGFLVSLVAGYVSQISPATRGQVHHMTLSGKTIRKYKRSVDGKTELFTYPKRVVQNINQDICVVDIINQDFTSRLVVLSVEGNVRFIYGGQSTLAERFSSNDVCCDSYGRILVTDFFNCAVHQLRPDGEFLLFILTKKDLPTAPKSIALYGDKLWVGCTQGIIQIFKYQ